MKLKRLKIIIPEVILGLSLEQRLRVAQEVIKSLGFKTTLTQDQLNQSVWLGSPDPAIAELEDNYYDNLAIPLWFFMLELFDVMGLDLPITDVVDKSVGEDLLQKYPDGRWVIMGDYSAYVKKDGEVADEFNYFFKEKINKVLDIDLLKADDGEGLRNKLMGEVRRRFKERLKFRPDGKPYTIKQLTIIKNIFDKFRINANKWAESLAVRSYIIGNLLASRDSANKDMLSLLFDTIPKDIKRVSVPFMLTSKEEGGLKMLPLQSQEVNAIKWAKLHAAEEVRTKEEEVLKGVKHLVVQARMERWEPQRLAQELFDQFGQYNRDWRRIAITETAKAVSNGYLMGLKDGDQVFIQESAGMCDHCRRLNTGKVFTYREIPGNEKTELWVGKTNYGRKTRDWNPCVPLHPHCRGRYVKFSDVFYRMDEKIGKIVRKTKDEIISEDKL